MSDGALHLLKMKEVPLYGSSMTIMSESGIGTR